MDVNERESLSRVSIHLAELTQRLAFGMTKLARATPNPTEEQKVAVLELQNILIEVPTCSIAILKLLGGDVTEAEHRLRELFKKNG